MVVALLLASVRPAAAYVGPGLGVGIVATVLGILGGLLLLLVGAVWYPLKRFAQAVRARFLK